MPGRAGGVLRSDYGDRRPARRQAVPSDVAPHGIEIAGCPVTLNNCVSRSISARTGSARAVDDDGFGADRRRGNRQRREDERVAPGERGVDLAAQQLSALHRPHVVLREHVPSQPRAAAARRACSGPRECPASARGTSRLPTNECECRPPACSTHARWRRRSPSAPAARNAAIDLFESRSHVNVQHDRSR